MNSNGNYFVIGHISEDSEPVEVISGDGLIRIVNAGGAVFVGETVLNSYDFPIKISLINNKSILVGLQQERLLEMSDLDAGISSIDYSNGIDQPVDDFSTNDSSEKDGVIVEKDRLASQSLIERSDKDVDEVFYKSNRVVGIDESQFTEDDLRGDLPAIPVNNLPIIQSQSFTVNENVPSDGSFTIGAVKVIDLDEDQSHVYAIVGGNSDGRFAINPATGDITVVGEIDYENIDSYDLSIKVIDNGIPPLTTFKTITIDIENANEAPVANPDVATSDENGSLTINVLANDTDADVNDNPSSSILLSTDIVDTNGDILVGMGEVSISNNQVLFALGSDFDYLGDGEVMDLLIRYQMSDSGGLTSNSFLSITITGTNDQPVIDLINASGTLEESNSTTGLSTTGTLSFTELDSGDIVTVSKSDTSITWNGGDLTSSLSASLMSGFVISNSGWSYSTSANLDFLGEDETIILKYNVIGTDNSGSGNAASAGEEVTVTITGTNDQPVIDSITTTGTLVEGDGTDILSTTGALSFTELDSGDTVTISKSDTSITWNGGDLTSSISTNLLNGFVVSNEGWSYNTNVNLDFLGKDQTIVLKYNVIATDNSGATNAESADEEITVIITGTNDAPIISSDVSLSNTAEDTSIIITKAEILANATDAEGANLSVENLTVDSGILVDNGDNTWTFTPSENFNGDVAINYNISDGIDITEATRYIHVDAVADAVNISLASTMGEVGETITSLGDNNITGSGANAQLSGWLTDNNGGMMEANPDTTYGAGDNRGTVLELERNVGDESNIYQNVDVQAGDTVKLTFDLCARTGTATGQGQAVDVMWEGVVVDTIVPNEVSWESYTYTFTATTDNPRLELNAPGSDGIGAVLDVITVQEIVSELLEGSALTVRLSTDLVDTDGSENITSVVMDGVLAGTIVSDGVNSVTVTEDGGEVDILGWDFSNLTITPDENFFGTFDVNVTATSTDANGTTAASTASTEFVISNINDGPEFSGSATANTDEDTSITLTQGDLLANATDEDGDALTASNVQVNGDNATVVDNGDGTFTVTPDANFSGELDLTFDVSDGELTTAGTMDLTINSINDGPVAMDDIDLVGTLQLTAAANLEIDSGLSNSTGFSTVSMWFKTDRAEGQLFGIDSYTGDGGHDRRITITSNGNISTYTWDGGTNFETLSTTGLNVADGEWHNFVYSLDGNDMHLYVDGSLAVTGNIGSSGFDWSDTMTIGRDVTGDIRDVKVFEDTGATAAEAKIIMDGDIPSSMTSNLKFAMNFSGDNPYYANGITVTKSGTPNTEDQFTHQANFDDNAISNFNVLANDSDLDGDTLSISGVSDAVDTNGNVIGTVTVVNIDGVDQVQFIGNAATVGLNDGEQLEASFTYTLSDGNGGADTATVKFLIKGNDNVGTLIDGVIDGVVYTTSSGITGLTDADGAFLFNNGDTITFSIGNIELGTITAEEAQSGQTFLQDIANVDRGDLNDHYLENMATFLQSLDSDEGDNIVITAEMHAKLEESKLDLHTASEEEVKALVESIGKEFVSEEDAMEHVQEMLEKYTDMQSDDFDAHTDDSLTTARLGTLPVVGVNYTTSSGITGITNTDGSFSFNIGDEITFSNANGQEIASIAAEHIGSDKLITMQELLTHAPDMQTQGNEAGTLFIANDDREVIFTDADLFSDNNLVPQTSIDDVDNAGANSLLTDSGTVPDLFSTNHDNISVSGGASIYTFDLNAAVTPENKTSFSVSDFNIDEGDVLLLGDLMVDEDNSLEQLLDFSTSSSETVINIRDFAGGDVTSQVTLDNVDLSVYGNTDAEIINKLLVDGSLQIDS
ncbi:MAG: tandem-95 repeat protein [Candidatus Endonucleobacter sp. (ex Gigantidas childressi)]|nr:tandem-95 repeat protein [Candidatus Endonucleobacter sp. (ex Gigantidas childressi)]